MKIKFNLIRIENDKKLTLLLKRHKKYKLEYRLNVYCQGYDSDIVSSFTTILLPIAMALEALKVIEELNKQ
jgi:hypothetical protein